MKKLIFIGLVWLVTAGLILLNSKHAWSLDFTKIIQPLEKMFLVLPGKKPARWLLSRTYEKFQENDLCEVHMMGISGVGTAQQNLAAVELNSIFWWRKSRDVFQGDLVVNWLNDNYSQVHKLEIVFADQALFIMPKDTDWLGQDLQGKWLLVDDLGWQQLPLTKNDVDVWQSCDFSNKFFLSELLSNVEKNWVGKTKTEEGNYHLVTTQIELQNYCNLVAENNKRVDLQFWIDPETHELRYLRLKPNFPLGIKSEVLSAEAPMFLKDIEIEIEVNYSEHYEFQVPNNVFPLSSEIESAVLGTSSAQPVLLYEDELPVELRE